MKFIFNNTEDENHLQAIIEHLKQSREAYFAVAFLKISGLNLIMDSIESFLQSSKKLKIVAGQNFALTEPDALRKLHSISEKYPKLKLFLENAESKSEIFHPKLYLFKSDTNCYVISGSANITSGGLKLNKEASILVECKDEDEVWIESKNYFDYLINDDNARRVDLPSINQYESYFNQQKSILENSKSIPRLAREIINFNYVELHKKFNNFNSAERDKKYDKRMKEYNEARYVLNQIADFDNLTQDQFQRLLDKLVGAKGVKRLWHSGSMSRLRNDVYPHFKEFQRLVAYIRDNQNKSADIVYHGAKGIVTKIRGAAANYVTEIMMTYNYNDFANLNSNPITVLREVAGVNIKGHSSHFNGVDYLAYCNLLKEIIHKLGLRNMLEVDSFFNEIYREIRSYAKLNS